MGVRTGVLVVRSIPAHAGEPRRSTGASRSAAVYPRPRGGAKATGGKLPCHRGLSPPTRGSQLARFRATRTLRSIPAHAGEPAPHRTAEATSEVYPRPRGGARQRIYGGVFTHGLSPPTRGSPRPALYPLRSCWSIPAHAGEPHEDPDVQSRRGVYPRPRGGANGSQYASGTYNGLSPPTRGSPYRSGCRGGCPRSIPAHAGEPHEDPDVQSRRGVYPRPRGGAGRIPK